jgi:hypothetical protein
MTSHSSTLTANELIELQRAFTRFVNSGDTKSKGYGINHPETNADENIYAKNFCLWIRGAEPQNARKLTLARAIAVVRAWYADDDPSSDSF